MLAWQEKKFLDPKIWIKLPEKISPEALPENLEELQNLPPPEIQDQRAIVVQKQQINVFIGRKEAESLNLSEITAFGASTNSQQPLKALPSPGTATSSLQLQKHSAGTTANQGKFDRKIPLPNKINVGEQQD